MKATNKVYTKRYVKKGEIAAYSLSGGGQVFGYELVTGYLTYFYINVFHIDPKLVGLMLLLEGIWDVVNNPLAGMVIDRTRTKSGKMLPYLRFLMAPLAIVTVLLFAGPYLIHDTSPVAISKIAFMFGTYFIWELFYTFTDVSYWGLSAAISPNPDDRSRVMTTTNFSQSVFSALPFILVPLLMDYSAANSDRLQMKTVFMLLGIIAGVVGIGLFALSGIFVKERVEQSVERSTFRESARELVTNSSLRAIVLSGLVRSLSGISIVFMNYYFIDVLGYASLSILAQIPAMVTWAFSYALIPIIKKRWNEKQFSIIGSVLIGSVWIVSYLIGIKFYKSTAVMIPVIMIGQGLMGLINAPFSIILNEMMADSTDYSEWKTGKRSEGVSFSMKITTQKISGTIVQSFASMLLSGIGYVTSSQNARVPQTITVQQRIWMMFTLIPGIVYLLSAIPYFFYDLVGEKKAAMLRELAQRRGDIPNQPQDVPTEQP